MGTNLTYKPSLRPLQLTNSCLLAEQRANRESFVNIFTAITGGSVCTHTLLAGLLQRIT